MKILHITVIGYYNEFVNKKDLIIAAGHPPSTTYGDLTIRRFPESGKGYKNFFRFKR